MVDGMAYEGGRSRVLELKGSWPNLKTTRIKRLDFQLLVKTYSYLILYISYLILLESDSILFSYDNNTVWNSKPRTVEVMAYEGDKLFGGLAFWK